MPQVLAGNDRKNIVGHFGKHNSVLLRKNKQQYPQRQEQQIDRGKSKAVGDHIFLGIFQVLYRQVLLHLVLVQPRHHNGNEHPAEKLFEEILRACPVVKHENTGMRTLAYSPKRVAPAEIESCHYLPDDQHQGRQEKQGLDPIRPYDGFDAAFMAVEPDNENNPDNRYNKGNAPGIENQRLKNKRYQV